MAYIISIFGGSSYWQHEFDDKKTAVDKASKFLTGDYSGTSRIVVEMKTGMIVYQNIKDNHIEMTSGLHSQTSGVMKEGLIKRLKQNAIAKVKAKAPVQKETPKVQKKPEQPPAKNEQPPPKKEQPSPPKKNLEKQAGGFTLLIEEERKVFLAMTQKFHREMKQKLKGEKLLANKIWRKQNPEDHHFLFLQHMTIPEEGAKLRKYTFFVKEKEKEYILYDIFDGHLYLSD